MDHKRLVRQKESLIIRGVFSNLYITVALFKTTTNPHVVKIMKRIRSKLEGVDFNVKHKMSVSEQVWELPFSNFDWFYTNIFRNRLRDLSIRLLLSTISV